MRQALVYFFRRVVSIYFRDIEVTGNLPAKDTGGRLFVSNHTNGLLDPILVLTTAPCIIAPIGKSTLWKIPGLRWLLDQAHAVPIVRRKDDPTKATGSNDEVFDKVASALAGGTNILVFPEGVSHNEPHLVHVRTGPARMLARAYATGGRGLTFQAVALEFDERDMFRSRCLLVYGPVRRVDELAEGRDNEGLVQAITGLMRGDLEELLVEGADWAERLLIARVAEMITNDTGERSLERWNEIGRRVEAARKALREGGEATVAEVSEAVGLYYARLAEEGLADEQLAEPSNEAKDGGAIAATALWLSLPLAAAGAILYWAPYQVTRLSANRIATGADELSTYKIGVGLLAYPVWGAILVGVGFTQLPLAGGIAVAAVAVTSPFAALAWHDALPRLRRALRFATHATRLAEVRGLRAEAMARIQAAREGLGV